MCLKGFPLKDAEGKDLSKSAIKDYRKEYASQVKLHQKFLDSQKWVQVINNSLQFSLPSLLSIATVWNMLAKR